MKFKRAHIALALMASVGLSGLYANAPMGINVAEAATSVAFSVNGNAITNYDIQRRVAFLKLQQQSGNLNAIARQQLTDEMLKRIEMKRRNVDVPERDVNEAYGVFAQRNNMSVEQLSHMLNEAGVTPQHFMSYIMVQMGWGRLVSMRYKAENGGTGLISQQDAVQRILKNGGKKPVANEYKLQQVIFVIPEKRRSQLLSQRLQQANAYRARFKGCAQSRQTAKGILDVTIRDQGRILEQQLPPDWEQAIKATPAGKLTPPRQSPRGVEMIAVCEIRKVSDDRVAQLVYTLEDNKKYGDKELNELSEKYLKELKRQYQSQR